MYGRQIGINISKVIGVDRMEYWKILSSTKSIKQGKRNK